MNRITQAMLVGISAFNTYIQHVLETIIEDNTGNTRLIACQLPSNKLYVITINPRS